MSPENFSMMWKLIASIGLSVLGIGVLVFTAVMWHRENFIELFAKCLIVSELVMLIGLIVYMITSIVI